jgi:hypothetical protein
VIQLLKARTFRVISVADPIDEIVSPFDFQLRFGEQRHEPSCHQVFSHLAMSCERARGRISDRFASKRLHRAQQDKKRSSWGQDSVARLAALARDRIDPTAL